MRFPAIAIVASLAGCHKATPHVATVVDSGSAAATQRPRRSALLALHMRDHYADLRKMERYLVDGEIAPVRDYAVSLAYQPHDPELAPWSTYLERMREAAMALGMAGDVLEAARLEPALATACADCHAAAGVRPRFEDVPLPADDGTSLARMARHQWAADRLWEAMIVPSESAWKTGLDVLAATPLPPRELTTVAMPSAHTRIGELGVELQQLARRSILDWTSTQRVRVYGEILRVCASCHDLAR